jgi:hypothetical protein
MRQSAILLVAAVIACGDSTSPVVLSGTYTVQTIDAKPLPFKSSAGASSEYYVTGATLSFTGDNTATLTVMARVHDLPPNERWTDLAPRVVTLSYARNGNNLTIETSSEIVPAAGIGLTASDNRATVTLHYPVESTFYYDGNHAFLFTRD